MNDYYICVRRFVVSHPELPDSLYHQLPPLAILWTFTVISIFVRFIIDLCIY